MATAALSIDRPRFDVSQILKTGAVVALSDGLFAELYYVPIFHKTTTMRLWQGLASSLLGKDAFDGGVGTMLLGLAIHVCVAVAWSTVFAVAYTQIGALRRAVATTGNAIVVGLLYGPFIWLMMQYVIIPLTRIKPGPVNTAWWVQFSWHAIGIGLPIVLMTRRETT